MEKNSSNTVMGCVNFAPTMGAKTMQGGGVIRMQGGVVIRMQGGGVIRMQGGVVIRMQGGVVIRMQVAYVQITSSSLGRWTIPQRQRVH